MFKVWTEDPLVKILLDSPVPASAGSSIEVDAVRNEYESAQIIVTPQVDVEKLTVKATKLKGPSSVVPDIQVRFAGFIPIKYGTQDTPPEHLIFTPPADAPDPLLEVKSVTVKAGKNQPIWLTVYIPQDAAPGVYTGKATVTADGVSQSVPISIKVYPITLPDERTLYLTNWFTPNNIASAHKTKMWSERFWKMLESYAAFMAKYRQNTVITPVRDLTLAIIDDKGDLTFDFSQFDRWVELFRRAGVIGYIESWHLGGKTDWTTGDLDVYGIKAIGPDDKPMEIPAAKTSSPDSRKFLSQFLPALQKHLDEKGWTDIFFQHLADEPVKENSKSYNALSAMVREFAPKLKIIDASMCTEIAGSLDIWIPMPPEIEKKMSFFKKRRKAGDGLWFYTCCHPKGKYMNRFIDYPLLDTRLLHWMNFKYDMPGYLHWGLNYWSGDPMNQERDWYGGTHLPPGDSHIAYPGKNGLLSSIRLETLRDGVEDYELLRLLEKKHPRIAKKICGSVVRTMTDYTLDPAEFRTARRQLLEALVDTD